MGELRYQSRSAISTGIVYSWLSDRNSHRASLWGRIFSLFERRDRELAAEWFAKEVNDFADWLVEKGYSDPRGVIEDAQED